MECPVCYEQTAKCRFKCGHSFCHSCTKSWLYKGNSTCPMCRKPMCFDGMIRLKKKWNRENCEDVDFILRYAWIPIEALLDHHFVEYYDIFTFENLLFVNRTKYGNLSRYRKVEYSTFKHGPLSQNYGAVGQEL
jgi:predicted amidophosphoribosyltransferase